MGFTLTAHQEPKAFDKVPTGMYQAKLSEITEPKPYPGFPDDKTGKVKMVNKSRWIFEITFANDKEIVGEKLSVFINMDGAGEKSGLYKMLVSLGLDPNLQYETDELVGRQVQLYVKVESNKQGKNASNIKDISPLGNQPNLGRPVSLEQAAERIGEIPF